MIDIDCFLLYATVNAVAGFGPVDGVTVGNVAGRLFAANVHAPVAKAYWKLAAVSVAIPCATAELDAAPVIQLTVAVPLNAVTIHIQSAPMLCVSPDIVFVPFAVTLIDPASSIS
jgi:hypothetical protein